MTLENILNKDLIADFWNSHRELLETAKRRGMYNSIEEGVPLPVSGEEERVIKIKEPSSIPSHFNAKERKEFIEMYTSPFRSLGTIYRKRDNLGNWTNGKSRPWGSGGFCFEIAIRDKADESYFQHIRSNPFSSIQARMMMLNGFDNIADFYDIEMEEKDELIDNAKRRNKSEIFKQRNLFVFGNFISRAGNLNVRSASENKFYEVQLKDPLELIEGELKIWESVTDTCGCCADQDHNRVTLEGHLFSAECIHSTLARAGIKYADTIPAGNNIKIERPKKTRIQNLDSIFLFYEPLFQNTEIAKDIGRNAVDFAFGDRKNVPNVSVVDLDMLQNAELILHPILFENLVNGYVGFDESQRRTAKLYGVDIDDVVVPLPFAETEMKIYRGENNSTMKKVQLSIQPNRWNWLKEKSWFGSIPSFSYFPIPPLPLKRSQSDIPPIPLMDDK